MGPVRAIDCNPLAGRVARQNVKSNGLGSAIEVIIAQELNVLGKSSDLVLMNLEWVSLNKVLEERKWVEYRLVVLSGFLRSQWDSLKKLIPGSHQEVFRETIEDWVTVVLARH
jgi:ribosomal protein L11 methylase PrmA